MKALVRNLLLCCVVVVASRTARAQPANDNFANAWLLTGLGLTTNGTTAGAGRETGEPTIGANPGGHSVWFVWTAPSNTPIRIDTIGSGFDTLLGLYTGTAVNALTTIASNNDIGGGSTASLVQFTAIQGT